MRVLVLVACALLCASLVPAVARAVDTTPPSSLTAGSYLRSGERLVSRDGRFVAVVNPRGRLVVRTAAGQVRWATPRTLPGANLFLARTGQLALKLGGAILWSSGTSGSGRYDVLRLRNDGVLTLTSGGLVVWSSEAPNRCPLLRGKTFVVDLSAQRARACLAGQQLRTTLVTSGATDLGYGTPTGTWHVYAKARNTTLYPAAGGAYPVDYWLPYSGPYGMHDSSWQRFPYGSPLYRTRGSHGCVHVPARAMAWLYGWAPVGTRVQIRA